MILLGAGFAAGVAFCVGVALAIMRWADRALR